MRDNKQIQFSKFIQKIIFIIILLAVGGIVHSQVPGIFKTRPGSINPQSRTTTSNKKGLGAKSDTLGFKHRDDLVDSITISFRYLDSLKSDKLDSSVSDFNKIYSVPANYVTLGNNGSAAFPVLFTQLRKRPCCFIELCTLQAVFVQVVSMKACIPTGF